MTLIGNTIAGSEKDGLHWRGQKCSEAFRRAISSVITISMVPCLVFGMHVPAKGKYEECCVLLSGFKVSLKTYFYDILGL